MKKIAFCIFFVFVSAIAIAHTINWHVDNAVYTTTTCDYGNSIVPPSAPIKRGYTFQKWALPYTPIEYLESNGTQWINTGLSGRGGTIMEGKVAPRRKNNRYDVFIGVVSPNQNNFDASRNNLNYSANGAYEFQKASIYGIATSVTMTQNPIVFTLNTIGQTYTATINGVQQNVNPNNLRENITDNTTIKIGFSDWDGETHNQVVYWLKIYNSSNVLVRDFIPALDKNNVPCMYERVDGKFYYNAGTGNFIAGPVITP